MLTDEALFVRVREGDLRAFDDLYSRYETRLFGFLMGRLGQREDAEDAFHESFMRALRSREIVFEGKGSFRTWLFRIARNVAHNRRRSGVRGARALALLPPQEEAGPVIEDEIVQREKLAALDDAVSRLPPALAEVYQLRASGLSYEEIASVLEIPLGTLKSRMHQLVGSLRQEMKEWTARE